MDVVCFVGIIDGPMCDSLICQYDLNDAYAVAITGLTGLTGLIDGTDGIYWRDD